MLYPARAQKTVDFHFSPKAAEQLYTIVSGAMRSMNFRDRCCCCFALPI
jgi:hypothetical protein